MSKLMESGPVFVPVSHSPIITRYHPVATRRDTTRAFLLFLCRSLSLEARLTFSPERHPVSSADGDGCAANKIFHETADDSASLAIKISTLAPSLVQRSKLLDRSRFAGTTPTFHREKHPPFAFYQPSKNLLLRLRSYLRFQTAFP